VTSCLLLLVLIDARPRFIHMPSTRTLRVRPAQAPAPPNINRSTVPKGPRRRPQVSLSQIAAGPTTHLHALPQSIAPLPLPPATVPVAQLLARVFPDADDETRKVALSNMIRSEGSRKASLALLQDVVG
jgi:hypothetical protein